MYFIMSRLCEDLHPSLSADVLTKLFNKLIFSSLSFIRTNSELLSKISGLQYSQILQIKDAILTKYSSKLRTGNKHYLDVINHCAILPTGIEEFDNLLRGGFTTGKLYELCGFSGCGKTQICMTIAVNICISSSQEVMYIDTKNDFSASRLFEIIEHHKISNVGEIMQKIQVFKIKNAFELLKELNNLIRKLTAKAEKYLGFRLIIIDSLSALFQKFHNQNESSSLLNNVANFLKYICVEYHMVILLTNFVTSWTSDIILSETEVEEDALNAFQQIQHPALGKFWNHVPNERITVKKLENSNECFLITLKSLNQPTGKAVKIKLSDRGVI